MRYRYRYSRFKKKNPERYNTLTNKVIADLIELEKAVSNGVWPINLLLKDLDKVKFIKLFF